MRAAVAWFRIAAVSTISTMKVERPRARSSAAPTRLKSRSTTPMCARSAGTKEPIWARIAMSAFWRRKVLLPAMLGPVTSQSRCARPEVAVVGDEGAAPACRCERRLDHRMAPARDLEGRLQFDERAARSARSSRELGQPRGDVEGGERRGGRGDRLGARERPRPRAQRRARARGPAPCRRRCAILLLELGQLASW